MLPTTLELPGGVHRGQRLRSPRHYCAVIWHRPTLLVITVTPRRVIYCVDSNVQPLFSHSLGIDNNDVSSLFLSFSFRLPLSSRCIVNFSGKMGISRCKRHRNIIVRVECGWIDILSSFLLDKWIKFSLKYRDIFCFLESLLLKINIPAL